MLQGASGYWSFWGTNSFGITLLPMLLGVAILFFNARSWAGWLLAGAGTVIIFAGILTSLEIFFRQTSLFNLLLMLVLFVGGLGLMGRSLLRS